MTQNLIHCIPGIDLKNVQDSVINELKKFAEHIQCGVFVSSAYRPGDPAEHGKGLALDIIVPSYAGRLLDLYLATERFKFTGIGIYPQWKYGGRIVGGLHVDMRPATMGARWLGRKNLQGQNEYLALNQETLHVNGVI